MQGLVGVEASDEFNDLFAIRDDMQVTGNVPFLKGFADQQNVGWIVLRQQNVF
jgi:hypothetical protein